MKTKKNNTSNGKLLCQFLLLNLFLLLQGANLAPVYGQYMFYRSYGGNNPINISKQCRAGIQTADSGFVLAGWTNTWGPNAGPTYSGYNVWVVKTNDQGDTLWTTTVGTNSTEQAHDIKQTPDGGYAIVGWTDSTATRDIYLVKLNTSGTLMWTKTYDGYEGKALEVTSDGGFIIVGGGGSFVLIKTDANGDTTWTKTYGSLSCDAADVIQTSDGGYVILGSTRIGFTDIIVIRTDGNGNILWANSYDKNSGSDKTTNGNIVQTSDGNFVIGCYFDGSPTSGPASLVKLDDTNQGAVLWAKRYYYATWINVGLADAGNLIMAIPGGGGAHLVKLNATGDTLWARRYNTLSFEWVYQVQQTFDGGYMIALRDDGAVFGWSSQYTIIKTDRLGRASYTNCNEQPPLIDPVDITADITRNLNAISASGYINAYASITSRQMGSNPVLAIPCSVVLPIELLSFDATLLSNKTVLCEWKTESEINNDYFTVEKIETPPILPKGEGNNWVTIDTVDGAGNSSIPLYYNLIDKMPYQGVSYYRLKQTDFNGDYTYSNLRAINLEGIDIINLSPNPAEEEIKVLLYSNEKTNIRTKVFNMLGQQVIGEKQIANKGTTELLIDIWALSSGYYLIEVMTESGLYRSHKKLVKR